MLLMQLDDQKLEQAECHVVKVLEQNDFKLSKIHGVSKSIARAVSAVSQYQKKNSRKFYEDRKHKPLEQWPKVSHGWSHMQNEHKDSLRPKTINKRNKKAIPYPEIHCWGIKLWDANVLNYLE